VRSALLVSCRSIKTSHAVTTPKRHTIKLTGLRQSRDYGSLRNFTRPRRGFGDCPATLQTIPARRFDLIVRVTTISRYALIPGSPHPKEAAPEDGLFLFNDARCRLHGP
jgi:hypothetical protein